MKTFRQIRDEMENSQWCDYCGKIVNHRGRMCPNVAQKGKLGYQIDRAESLNSVNRDSDAYGVANDQ